MVVGFTGTRRGATPRQHASMRRFLTAMFTRFGAAAFVHGGARGCDTLAHYIVETIPCVHIEVFPSGDAGSIVWTPAGRTVIHEAQPPLQRNRSIVHRIHGLLAVPATDAEEPIGTWATVRYARKYGCPVYIVRQNGSIHRG